MARQARLALLDPLGDGATGVAGAGAGDGATSTAAVALGQLACLRARVTGACWAAFILPAAGIGALFANFVETEAAVSILAGALHSSA